MRIIMYILVAAIIAVIVMNWPALKQGFVDGFNKR